jgi:hypothetical protein
VDDIVVSALARVAKPVKDRTAVKIIDLSLAVMVLIPSRTEVLPGMTPAGPECAETWR